MERTADASLGRTNSVLWRGGDKMSVPPSEMNSGKQRHMFREKEADESRFQESRRGVKLWECRNQVKQKRRPSSRLGLLRG